MSIRHLENGVCDYILGMCIGNEQELQGKENYQERKHEDRQILFLPVHEFIT
jgi:hypothetical protein